MLRPSREEFRALARDHTVVPVWREVLADLTTPVAAFLRIVGEEVTTPGGHAGVWGLGGWRDGVDFRLIPGDERIKDLVRAVSDRGAVFVVNHPVADCAECSWEHSIPPGVVGMEMNGFSIVWMKPR